jgi:hypothetical protein
MSPVYLARLAGKAMVSLQNPVRLSRYTEPQPDILLAPWRDDFYTSKGRARTFGHRDLGHNHPDDHNRKMLLYAKAGVRELWTETLQGTVSFSFIENPARKHSQPR